MYQCHAGRGTIQLDLSCPQVDKMRLHLISNLSSDGKHCQCCQGRDQRMYRLVLEEKAPVRLGMFGVKKLAVSWIHPLMVRRVWPQKPFQLS
jgi:hypothetical protein